MKKLVWVLLLLFALPVLGADLEFRLSPTGPPVSELPLNAQFYVVVTGCCTKEADVQQVDGIIFLANIQTGKNIWVPLQAQDQTLIAGPIKTLGANAPTIEVNSLVANVGDQLSAQTALVGGLNASVKIGSATISLSSPIALPGSTVRLTLNLVATRTLDSAHITLVLPPNWHALPQEPLALAPQGFLYPKALADGRVTPMSFLVELPPDAFGKYDLEALIVELGENEHIALGVGEYLPPEIVVAHWDVQADKLDLSSSPTVSYDELRWASTHLGETLPYTARPLTKQILTKLAGQWQEGQVAYRIPSIPAPPPAKEEEPKQKPEQAPVPPKEEEPAQPAAEQAGTPAEEPVPPVEPIGPLVAQWQFDETSGTSAADASGSGNKGTLHDAAWSAGKIGNAAKFDGVKSYIEVADSDSLDLSDSFTIAAWVNLGEVGTGRQVLLQKKSADKNDVYTNYTLYAQWTQDALALVIGDGTRRVGYLSEKGLGTPNVWHHIAVSFGGGKVRFYIDGKPAGEETATIKPYINSGPVVIGRYTNADNTAKFFLNGSLDDLRIYNKALNQEEIKSL